MKKTIFSMFAVVMFTFMFGITAMACEPNNTENTNDTFEVSIELLMKDYGKVEMEVCSDSESLADFLSEFSERKIKTLDMSKEFLKYDCANETEITVNEFISNLIRTGSNVEYKFNGKKFEIYIFTEEESFFFSVEKVVKE